MIDLELVSIPYYSEQFSIGSISIAFSYSVSVARRVQGRSAGSFLDQQLEIEPRFSTECRKLSVNYFHWFNFGFTMV